MQTEPGEGGSPRDGRSPRCSAGARAAIGESGEFSAVVSDVTAAALENELSIISGGMREPQGRWWRYRSLLDVSPGRRGERHSRASLVHEDKSVAHTALVHGALKNRGEASRSLRGEGVLGQVGSELRDEGEEGGKDALSDVRVTTRRGETRAAGYRWMVTVSCIGRTEASSGKELADDTKVIADRDTIKVGSKKSKWLCR